MKVRFKNYSFLDKSIILSLHDTMVLAISLINFCTAGTNACATSEHALSATKLPGNSYLELTTILLELFEIAFSLKIQLEVPIFALKSIFSKRPLMVILDLGLNFPASLSSEIRADLMYCSNGFLSGVPTPPAARQVIEVRFFLLK